MKICLHGGGSASEQDITALENMISQKIDFEFLEFIRNFDGATPDSNSFSVSGVRHMGSVRKFIPISGILSERGYISDSQSICGEYSYPIAFDDCGNYIVLDQGPSGGVFFWDHELDKASKVADTFAKFLELIEPFALQEEDVANFKPTKVWVDPSFKPEF